MELIKEIYQQDIGEENKLDVSYRVRKAARALLFNDSNEIAVLYVSKNNYHKLPGGGIEQGENIESALEREVMEEVGASINVTKEVGTIIEYRDEFNQLQISYCFIGKVKGDILEPSFTESELSNGFQLKWINFDEAINMLKNDKPNNYVGRFISKRDLTFLLKAKEVLSKNN